MPRLSDTIARLAAGRDALPAVGAGRLTPLEDFGDDPGALRALVHVPAAMADRPALVVVLHGCTQSAAAYDAGSGWSQLADRHGFAVLFPEQRRQNNPNLCFNWFAPSDVRRGQGEAASIRQMIAAMVERHGIDPARVFVTGLSAGGAMAAALLATYPEVFAGGAIVAGLPYGTAAGVGQAMERMAGRGLPAERELSGLVRAASPHLGPWPVLSVWHGTADRTVAPTNGEAIVDQWRGLHGVGAAPTRVETIDGQVRRTWCDADGRAVIEAYAIAGLGHGTPLATGGDGCGAAGPYMLEAGISSSQHICRFWELANDRVQQAPGADAPRGAEAVPRAAAPSEIGGVIEGALRAAGLMR